jgi:hypothetical protein
LGSARSWKYHQPSPAPIGHRTTMRRSFLKVAGASGEED